MKMLRILILAGGKGSRMGASVPKAMVEIGGRPIVDHIMLAIEKSGLDEKPTLLVGHGLESLKSYVGDRARYVLQHEQRGTGHAVMVAEGTLQDADTVLVSYGDHALYTGETFCRIAEHHNRVQPAITISTTVLPDFEDWRKVFWGFGRVSRSENGNVLAVKELKNCSSEEAECREVNNGMYCFDAEWLWHRIHDLSDKNSKQEFLLTDLIAFAVADGLSVEAVSCLPEEGIGVNTPEEVAIAEEVFRLRSVTMS